MARRRNYHIWRYILIHIIVPTQKAIVKLRAGDKVFAGRGISTDVIGASIRAYVDALNKIAYERGNK